VALQVAMWWPRAKDLQLAGMARHRFKDVL